MGATVKLNGQNPDKKKKKQVSDRKLFIKKTIKIFIILLLTSFLAFTGIAIGTIYGWVHTATPITDSQLKLNKLTSIVLDRNGNEICKLTGTENIDRLIVHDTGDNIPKNLKNAFVAIEDERFEKHNGFDLYGFIRAGVKKFTQPGNREGGSTITMQLVKNLSGEKDYKLKRKVQEIWRAMDLEKRHEKWEILEAYMNTIPMGGNTYGIQAASLKYFGKEVKELDLAECASLAGITQSPTKFRPVTEKGRENNKIRQQLVLKRMLKNKFISKEEYESAKNEVVKFDYNPNILKQNNKYVSQTTSVRPYFVDQVLKDVTKDLRAEGKTDDYINMNLYNGGFTIKTTMDSDIQKGMDEVFNDENYFPGRTIEGEKPQSAMVIIDPSNGQVVGMYGGHGKKQGDNVLNRATQSHRPAGSSFKPIADYAPAIDQHLITAATSIDDVPVYMNGANRGEYPRNYPEVIDGVSLRTHMGLVSIRTAVAKSINVVAAKVFANILTPSVSFKYIEKSGIKLDKDRDIGVSVALGGLTKGVCPMDMAAAYVPFDNKGVYYQPITYTTIEDKDGNVILNKLDKEISPDTKQENHIVYDDKTSFIMTSLLRSVCSPGGTASYATFRNSKGYTIPIAAKTGTSNNENDRWFVGYSSYYVGAVWYGYDTPHTVYAGSRNPATMIWKAVMEKAHKNLSPVEFAMPSDIVKRNVCKYSGKLPNTNCAHDPRGNSVISEYFIKGTEPTDTCKVHVPLKVDVKSRDAWGRNLLAGSHCPSSQVKTKVFLHRLIPYMPSRAGALPDDWKYSDPGGEYCNIHGR